jgi:hypothetical protein
MRKLLLAGAFVALAFPAMAQIDNCRDQLVASVIMGFMTNQFHDRGLNFYVVDLEHITTVSLDRASASIVCHVTAVIDTHHGGNVRFTGTATIKENAAGEPLYIWSPDHAGRSDP